MLSGLPSRFSGEHSTVFAGELHRKDRFLRLTSHLHHRIIMEKPSVRNIDRRIIEPTTGITEPTGGPSF
ncbi:hypothetical protein Hanom_Chr16g01449501 [Helianthus anomalus]